MLTGKTAIITGGAGGLGRAFGAALAGHGAAVALVDLDGDAAVTAAQALPTRAGTAARHRGLGCDVRDRASVQETVRQIQAEFGRIDMLVNNAGGSLHTPKALDDIEERHWDLVLDVNLKGAFLFCQSVVPLMRSQGEGRIVNVSSIGGRTASVVTGVPYAAAKAGVIGLTRRLAYELGEWNINVNAIAPGTVLSGARMEALWHELSAEQRQRTLDTVPLGRLGTAEEQAEAVLFLVSPASRYMTGAVLDVNGGRFMG